MDLRKILLEHGICGSFFLWLSTSPSQAVIKKSSYVNFSHSNWGQCFSENFIILNKKVSFDDIIMTTLEWEVESQRKKKQQIPHLGIFFLLNSVFLSFKDSKIALIISLQKNFKCFFLSGSIKTFTSFEDFFFKVQFPKYVSEIWLEEFF